MVLRVEAGGWEALDRKEGAPNFYRRVRRTCLTSDGNAHEVETYEVPPDQRGSFVEPAQEYVDVVKQGLESWDLPYDHMGRAAGNLPAEPIESLFVYGTLMRGEPRHDQLGELHTVLLAETPGRLYDCGEYPAMELREDGGRTIVQGEFVRLQDASRSKELDEVEEFHGFSGERSLFERRLIEVGMHDRHVRRAWMYIGSKALDGRRGEIASGGWREHIGRRPAFIRKLVEAHCDGGDQRAGQRRSVSALEGRPRYRSSAPTGSGARAVQNLGEADRSSDGQMER